MVPNHQKELFVARIISGSVRLNVADIHGNPITLLMKKPSLQQLYTAQEIYNEIINAGDGYSEQEYLEFLVDEGFWDEEKQKLLDKLPKEIEDFKVKLFQLHFRSNEKKVIKKALGIAKQTLFDTQNIKNAHYHLSCLGSAIIARSKYLLACSLYYQNGLPVFTDDSFWEDDSKILNVATEEYNRIKLDDIVIRELSRTEPWRTIWSCRKAEGNVFGVPVVDYTDEQKALINWSGLYDNIFQHSECPSDEVIEDDDILDGWMILQKRQREDRLGKKLGDDLLTNEKIRNSSEIFIPAETPEDIKKIINLNTEHGKIIQKQRFDFLKKQEAGKEINHDQLPDVQRELRMKSIQRIKGN